MRAIVYPDAAGIISHAGVIIAQEIAPEARIVEIDNLAPLAPNTAARLKADGTVEIVANWIGSGPWFDQQASTADRDKSIHITEYGVEPASTWAMTQRAETAAEKKAREKAEADAKAAADAEAKNARTITPAQFNKAMILSGLKVEFRAALTAAGKTETEIEIAMADIEYAWEPMRFDNAKFIASATMLGKTEADREAFWQMAMGL